MAAANVLFPILACGLTLGSALAIAVPTDMKIVGEQPWLDRLKPQAVAVSQASLPEFTPPQDLNPNDYDELGDPNRLALDHNGVYATLRHRQKDAARLQRAYARPDPVYVAARSDDGLMDTPRTYGAADTAPLKPVTDVAEVRVVRASAQVPAKPAAEPAIQAAKAAKAVIAVLDSAPSRSQ